MTILLLIFSLELTYAQEFYLIAQKKNRFYGWQFNSLDSGSYRMTKSRLRLDIDSLPASTILNSPYPILISIECSDDDFQYYKGFQNPINYRNGQQFLPSNSPYYFIQIEEGCIPFWAPRVWWPTYKVLLNDTVIFVHDLELEHEFPELDTEQLEQLIEEVKLLNKGGKLLDESLNKGFNELSRALANRKGDGSTEIYIPDTLISAFPREVLDLLRDRLNQEKNQPIVIVQQPFSELFNPIFLYSFLGVLLALMCFLIYKTNKDCCCSDKSTPEEEKDEDWINKIKSLITKKEILVDEGEE